MSNAKTSASTNSGVKAIYDHHKEKALVAYHAGKYDIARIHFESAVKAMEERVQSSPSEEIRAKRSEILVELVDFANHCAELHRSPPPAPANALTDLKNVPRNQQTVEQGNDAARPILKSLLYTGKARSFDDVIGHEDAKEQIRNRMILPTLHPEEAKEQKVKPGGNLLLYGPPGTGKTELASAVAAQVNAQFYVINSSDLMSKWFGESEKNVRQMFKELAEANKPAVLFLDDGAGMLTASQGGSTSGVEEKILSEFLTGLDGIRHRDDGGKAPLCFMVATNRPWLIAAGMLSRLGGAQIYMGLPNQAERERILLLKLNDVLLGPDVNIAEIAAKTEGYAGRDLANLAENALRKNFALRVSAGLSTVQPLTQEVLLAELKTVKPSSTPAQIAEFEQFHQRQRT